RTSSARAQRFAQHPAAPPASSRAALRRPARGFSATGEAWYGATPVRRCSTDAMSQGAPDPPVIDAHRLQLRPLAVGDAEALHRAYGDPEAMRFWDSPATASVAETAQCIARSRSVSPEWHAAWGIALKGGDRRIVGMVNYHRREPWNHRLE